MTANGSGGSARAGMARAESPAARGVVCGLGRGGAVWATVKSRRGGQAPSGASIDSAVRPRVTS